MCAESKPPTHPKNAESQELGAPELLELLHNIKAYKITEPVTGKFQLPLAKYIREHGGSTFIRQAVMEKLEREAYE